MTQTPFPLRSPARRGGRGSPGTARPAAAVLGPVESRKPERFEPRRPARAHREQPLPRALDSAAHLVSLRQALEGMPSQRDELVDYRPALGGDHEAGDDERDAGERDQ